MSVFALYIPTPAGMWQSIVVLVIVFLMLCGCASWMKLSVRKSALAMLIGACVVLVALSFSVWDADLGDDGDRARELSETSYGDAFFAATMLMEVGWGKMYVFAGMVGGMSFVVLGKWLRQTAEAPAGTESATDE